MMGIRMSDPKNKAKPVNIIDKIIEGKMKTWLASNVLLEQPFDAQIEYVIGLIFNAVYLDQCIGDLSHVPHIPQFLYGQLDLGRSLVDEIGHFLDAHVVWIDLIKVDLFCGRVDIIADIVQGAGQIMNVLPVKRGDKIAPQFGEDAMREVVIDVLLVLHLAGDGGPLVGRLRHHGNCLAGRRAAVLAAARRRTA